MEPTTSILSLRDILKVVFKRKWLIIPVAITTVVTTTVVVFLMPPTYESFSQILVRRSLPESEEPLVSQEQRNAPTSFRQVNQSDQMNTTISIIKSRDLVIAVMDQLTLTRESFEKIPDYRRYVRGTYNWIRETLGTILEETKYFFHLSKRPTPSEVALVQRERLINEVVKALLIEQVPDSDVLRVGFRCSDPILSKMFSDRISSMAMTWHFQKYHQPGTFTFFKSQAEKAADDLQNIEKKLSTTRNDLNLIGIEDRKKLIIQHRFQQKSRLNEVRSRIAASEAGILEIKKILALEPTMMTLSKETTVNPIRQQISEKLSDLELKRLDASNRLSEESRVLKEMDSTIKGWRSQLKSVPDRQEKNIVEGLNNVQQAMREKLLTLQAERASLIEEEKVIERHIADFDNNLKSINEGAYQVEDLERRARVQAATFEQYLKSEELARVPEAKQDARMANLSIVQTATLPVAPVKPRKWFYILLSGAGGLLFAIAWAFANEMNDNTIENEEQLGSELNTRSLGTLPDIKGNDLRQFPRIIPALLREPLFRMCKRMSLQQHEGENSVFGFSSSCHGEGTTTVALLTALTAAAQGTRKILLVDADPEGDLTKRFGMEDVPGLSDLGKGVELLDVIHPTDVKNLTFLPAGKRCVSGETPINVTNWTREMLNHADIVFIDFPPILDSGLCYGTFTNVDGLILVVAAHGTRRELLRRALVELANCKSPPLIGAVLNRRKFFVPEFLYRHV